MLYKYLAVSFLFLFSSYALGQSEEINNPLAFYADVMSNASVAEHRSYASKMFSNLITERLNTADSFEDGLEDLPWVFVRYDDERKFRFISWQVEENDEEFKYAVFYQSNNGELSKLGNENIDLDRRARYVGSDIYPTIIHSIDSFEDYYLISAYRQLPQGKVQKIIDVLTFEENKPVLGKSIFYENEQVLSGRGHKRVILNYSSVAAASLNMNLEAEEKSIVYDHIIDVPGKLDGEGMVSVPDGTYEAYIHKGKDKWVYVSNLYEGLEYNPKTSSPPTERN